MTSQFVSVQMKRISDFIWKLYCKKAGKGLLQWLERWFLEHLLGICKHLKVGQAGFPFIRRSKQGVKRTKCRSKINEEMLFFGVSIDSQILKKIPKDRAVCSLWLRVRNQYSGSYKDRNFASSVWSINKHFVLIDKYWQTSSILSFIRPKNGICRF